MIRACFLIIVILLSSCGQQGQVSQTTGELEALSQENTKELNFSWYVNYPWFAPPNAWGEDPVSAWLKEHKSVYIQWLAPNLKGSPDFETFIATGQFPDIICLNRGTKVAQLLQMDALLALDPYLDLLPNLKKWLGPVNIELLRSEDGKLYQFPNWYSNPESKLGNGTSGWAVNTKIYRALGSPSLETFDDLKDYLSRVKRAYPNVLPLEVSEDNQALNLYIRASAPQRLEFFGRMLGSLNGNVFGKVFEDPLVQDAFLYFARLSRENLLSQEAFFQSRDQVQQKVINQSVAVIASMDILGLLQNVGAYNDEAQYQIIWPPVKKGVDPRTIAISTSNSLGWNVNVFPKTSEPKIREILSYLDWLTGEEGQRILTYGPPGYFWNKVDSEGIPIWNEVYLAASPKQKEEARLFKWNWVGNTAWVDNGKVVANKRLPQSKRDKGILAQGEILWKTTMFSNILGYEQVPSESELGIKVAEMQDIFDETRRLAMLAKNDADLRSLLKEAQAKLDAAGYQEYLDYNQEQLSKRLDKLQKVQALSNSEL